MKLLFLLMAISLTACTDKPPILPTGTSICAAPYYGIDCLDSYGEFYTFKNGLPCNTCQTSTDKDPNGCAWTEGPGAPNFWCVRDCDICSAIISTFTKKN